MMQRRDSDYEIEAAQWKRVDQHIAIDEPNVLPNTDRRRRARDASSIRVDADDLLTTSRQFASKRALTAAHVQRPPATPRHGAQNEGVVVGVVIPAHPSISPTHKLRSALLPKHDHPVHHLAPPGGLEPRPQRPSRARPHL